MVPIGGGCLVVVELPDYTAPSVGIDCYPPFCQKSEGDAGVIDFVIPAQAGIYVD